MPPIMRYIAAHFICIQHIYGTQFFYRHMNALLGR